MDTQKLGYEVNLITGAIIPVRESFCFPKYLKKKH